MRRAASALAAALVAALPAWAAPEQPAAPQPHRDWAAAHAPPARAPAAPAPPHSGAHPAPPHGAAHPAPPRGAAHPVPPPKPAAPAVPPPAPVPAPTPAEPPKGSNTNLPLPRFASLKTDDVNLRTGPGTRYPIDWVYKRRELPVEIEREFEAWRLIADPDGVKGWVHSATLTGRRSFVVTGAERVVRADPNDSAAAVARLKPGVIGRIRACEASAPWCQVQVGEYRGWLKRETFWGTLPGEAIQ